MTKTLQSLLLLSAALICVTPASANYFSNPRTGINLNIGSAPNPTPADLRRGAVQERTTLYTDTRTEAAPPPASAPAFIANGNAFAPAPAQAPAPPPAVRQFLVFFNFDKSNLTPEASRIVAVAVMTARDTGMARIIVVGHTDTVGSMNYNQALSLRRAISVKAEMMRLGLDGGDILTVGKGFSEPLVRTGRGVREPMNRRAVIDLNYDLTAGLVPIAE